MANEYQLNSIDGASAGYVRYTITPDYGQPVYPGDLITISGTVYSRDFAIKSMSCELGYETSSTSFTDNKNISIAKGKSGKFTFAFNMPLLEYGNTRAKKIYVHFSTYDKPNQEWNVGGYSFEGVEDQHINYLMYKITPSVIAMDFDRANIDGEWSNEGQYFQCRTLKISLSQEASAIDITKATIVVTGGEEPEKTVELNTEQLQAALTESGYTETTPKIFSEASLLGVTYTLTLTLGDEFEQVVYVDEVPRAFANMHLSGAKTGGAAFGMFSTSTEDNPKFECAYPAHLYGGLGEETIKIIGNVIYPVGSIYICTDEISPIEVFGGDWEQIKDRFLLAAGDSYFDGDTGGNASYTLSATHKHLSPAGYSGNILGVIRINDATPGGKGKSYASVNAGHTGTLGDDISLAYTANATVSAEIPTIPPYIAVCVWKRLELYSVEQGANHE